MSPFWILWTITAVMVAFAVHASLRHLAEDRSVAMQAPGTVRLVGLLLLALLGSLVLRAAQYLLLPCLVLAGAVMLTIGYVVWRICEPMQRRRSL